MGVTRLAEVCADRLAREPCLDARRRPRSRPLTRHLPKKELGEYRDGKRVPSASVAFRIGEALRDLGLAHASGPLALLASGHFADAIGLLGLCGGWDLVREFFVASDDLLNLDLTAPPPPRSTKVTTAQHSVLLDGRRHVMRRLVEHGTQSLTTLNDRHAAGFSEAASRWFPPIGTDNEEKARRRERTLRELAKCEPIARQAYDVVSNKALLLDGRQLFIRMLILHTDDLKGLSHDTGSRQDESA